MQGGDQPSAASHLLGLQSVRKEQKKLIVRITLEKP